MKPDRNLRVVEVEAAPVAAGMAAVEIGGDGNVPSYIIQISQLAPFSNVGDVAITTSQIKQQVPLVFSGCAEDYRTELIGRVYKPTVLRAVMTVNYHIQREAH